MRLLAFTLVIILGPFVLFSYNTSGSMYVDAVTVLMALSPEMPDYMKNEALLAMFGDFIIDRDYLFKAFLFGHLALPAIMLAYIHISITSAIIYAVKIFVGILFGKLSLSFLKILIKYTLNGITVSILTSHAPFIISSSILGQALAILAIFGFIVVCCIFILKFVCLYLNKTLRDSSTRLRMRLLKYKYAVIEKILPQLAEYVKSAPIERALTDLISKLDSFFHSSLKNNINELALTIYYLISAQLRRRNIMSAFLNNRALSAYRLIRVISRLSMMPVEFLRKLTSRYLASLRMISDRISSTKTGGYLMVLAFILMQLSLILIIVSILL